MPQDFFRSFSVTTAGLVGVPSAVLSGMGSGLTQSAAAVQKASAVLSQHTGERDSLLRSLKVLFEDPAKLDHSAQESFLDELRDALIATNDSFAFIVRNALLILFSGVTHVPQVPLDLSIVGVETAKGLSRIETHMDKIQQASQKASTLDVQVKGSSASASSVSDELGKRSGEVIDQVHKDIDIDGNSHAGTHAKIGTTAAAGTVGTTAFLPTAVAVLTDVVGAVPRELSATHHFSAQESASQGDKNVYFASSGTSHATQESDSRDSKDKSLALEDALSDLRPAKKLSSEQGVTGPSVTALVRVAILSLFVESSRGINKTAIATIDGRIQKALRDATAQNPSGGADRIRSLHSNLSSLSNIMRLCAQNLGGSPAVKFMAQSSEVLSSRAITVLLSNVSELAEAMRQLLHPQGVPADQSSLASLQSPVESANPRVLAQSEATIREVLDRIEKENGAAIPGVNKDMASQLDTSASTGIGSLLATHSLFSTPVMLATQAVKKGSEINDAQKNEALMATLPSLTQALNAIQGSTRNMMAEMEQAMEKGTGSDETDRMSKVHGPLLSTHKSSGSTTATVYWALSAISLLCDELLTSCRSFTLIDQERMKAASKKVSDVPSKDESAQSTQQIEFDSHVDEPDSESATHALTAARLTLSHTGIALMHIAIELHRALEGQMDTVKRDLAMHSLQQTILASCAYASRYLAEGLLCTVGGASAVPVLFNGSANWSQRQVHSTDQHLHPEQTHSSEKSSKGDCSDSSQATGFSTDVVANTITNILKVIAQGGLIGLDTILKLVKVLEIVSLHRDSHIALQLETQDSSNPNGLPQNVVTEPSTASSAGTGAIFINMLEALQTLDKCCDTQSTLQAQRKLQEVVDEQIAGLGMLKDEEETRENKMGLKAFYMTLVRLLEPHNSEETYNSLVKRLDFGGIALSSYHTLFGAYGDRAVSHAGFTSQFANDDDAQGILRRFIDRAKEDYPLMKALHNALPEGQRSEKAQILYNHVFEEVFQHYKQVKMSDAARHGVTRRRIPTRDTFKTDTGLVVHLEPVEAVADDHQVEVGVHYQLGAV
jgi:hypothetical protein